MMDTDLADLADDLSIAADHLRALEAAKPFHCPYRHIADRRINALVRHTNKLINELCNIFPKTGILRPLSCTQAEYPPLGANDASKQSGVRDSA